MKCKDDPATARQTQYLTAIAALTAELGHPPSAVAIAKRLGVSRTGIRSQLLALERKGLLEDKPKMVSSGRFGLTRAALEALGWPKALVACPECARHGLCPACELRSKANPLDV